MNKELKNKILKMAAKDQKMRSGEKWNKNVDIQNTNIMKEIIKTFGWPDIDLVGKQASINAWLLVQHSDHDVFFQEKCLRLIKEKLKDNKVIPENYAYLKDRVNVNKKRLQLYGTQFYLNNKNKLVPRPIRDKKNLDKRREKYGLELFEKYQLRMKNIKG